VRVSAIVPAFEEVDNLSPVIDTLGRTLERELGTDWEIVIVASLAARDGTAELASRLAQAEPRISYLAQAEHDPGYGRALALGIERARGQWLLLIDADGQLDPGELPRFVPHMDRADLIVGYRHRRSDAWTRRAASRLYGAAVRAAGLGGVRDVDCAFKLIRKECLRGCRLGSRTGVVNAELVAHALARGARLVELPVSHARRSAGRPRFEARLGLLGTVPRPSEAIAMARELATLALRKIMTRSAAV
jgi:glycosyltransferase involved in cell wall biosynthesis